MTPELKLIQAGKDYIKQLRFKRELAKSFPQIFQSIADNQRELDAITDALSAYEQDSPRLILHYLRLFQREGVDLDTILYTIHATRGGRES